MMSVQNKPLILIIDDDQDLTNLLEQILENEGYRVLKAYNGNSALKLLEENTPDLIILDIIMPDMDGIEMLRHIREHHNMPVIMLTAKIEAASESDAFITGADDYVRKPFRTATLLARVKAKLRRSQ